MNIIELMKQGGIRIPKIQREYAQGREDNVKIRKNFAKALMNAVWGRKAKNLSLGYVFGYKDGNGVFYPLDGQQRLTTLFLLAWHCGTDMRGWRLDYEGRRNSQLFLKGLVEHPRNQKTLNSADEIRNSAWFFNDWEDDASVSGMLRMLEEFDCCWAEACDVMEHPNESHLERITFSVHLFEGYDQATFGNNYLRMNARGVPLTPWENLKALVTPHLGYSTISTVNNEITEGLWALRRDLPADERRIVEIDVMLESILRLAMFAWNVRENFFEKGEHGADSDENFNHEYLVLNQLFDEEFGSDDEEDESGLDDDEERMTRMGDDFLAWPEMWRSLPNSAPVAFSRPRAISCGLDEPLRKVCKILATSCQSVILTPIGVC